MRFLKSPKMILVLLAVCAVAGYLLWPRGPESSGPVPVVAAGPAPIGAPSHQAEARRTELPAWYEAVGTIESTTRIGVSARIAGEVVELHADLGDRVAAGDVLAELDDRELRARVEQARGGLRAAQASREEAHLALERTRRLSQRKAATAQALEAAEAEGERAEAQLAAAGERVAEAQVALGYARLTSPVAGVVQERSVDAGDMAWPGQPLYVLHDPGALRIEAGVRTGLIDRVAQGQELSVHIGELEPLFARVDEIVPAADPRSRTFLVRASLPETPGLLPGMFARLQIELDPRSVVLVPAEAVEHVGQLHTLFVLQSSRWERRYVTLGVERNGEREILSGLLGGETIGWND